MLQIILYKYILYYIKYSDRKSSKFWDIYTIEIFRHYHCQDIDYLIRNLSTYFRLIDYKIVKTIATINRLATKYEVFSLNDSYNSRRAKEGGG